MRGKNLAIGTSIAAATMAMLSLLPTAAHADYAPTSNDVVGVGSDTLQAGLDFIADGDHLGDAGYNSGKLNKFVSIDATADANTRLAYGVNGASSTCTPGTGATQGTGNANGTHTENGTPCTLNPTVALRSGTSPILRPNGSGAGYNLLTADAAGTNPAHLVDFSRASSKRNPKAGYSYIVIGSDPVGMLTASTSNDKRGLSNDELQSIYNCTTTNWNQLGGDSGTIVPLIPQPGSGTRDYFLGQIGVTTPGACVKVVEENDPEAIDASSSPINAIEPMSQSRLFLFQGKTSDGADNGAGGYFKDPSCVAYSTTNGCPKTLNPNVKLWTSADPAGPPTGSTFNPTRPLYIYFRDADLNSAKKFQPGSTLNWVRTMLYNPGGAPGYICSSAGQTLLSAAGIIPNANCSTSYSQNGQ